MFWKKKQQAEEVLPRIDDGVRLYAIGDIHGHANLLRDMHTAILKDSAEYSGARKVIVYMGDYVDRGYQSKEVIDILINNPMDGFEKVFILGNHEDAMLRFIDKPEETEAWLVWGGDSTLISYGVAMRSEIGARLSSKELAAALNTKMPPEHKQFCQNLQLSYVEGDYIFVHAGLRPGVALDKQAREDMLTIRDEFISSTKKFEKTVVFGHTIYQEPFFKNGRIGVDTGAYAYGKLTAVVLEGEAVRFLSVSKE